MKDNIEQFIKDNREELDMYEPREGLWESIDEKLHKQKELKRWKYYVAAACLLLAVSVAVWLVPKSGQDKLEVAKAPVATPEVKQAEVYYASMIEEKRVELNRYCDTKPHLCVEFEKELDTLNRLYGQLKQEYNTTATDKEVVLQAMINNLQVQVQVLSQQLHIIQQIHTKTDDKVNVL